MIIPTTIVIANIPKLPLQIILSLRTLGSTLFTELKEVYTKDNILSNILDFQADSNHYIMGSALLFFLYGQYKYNEGQRSIDNRIVEIDRFKYLKKMLNEIIFIFIIIFTKNVNEVF
jgi:hypothetical protein